MPPEDTATLAGRIEHGQADALVELALEAHPVAGGWMTFGGRGAFLNKACGLGLVGPVPQRAVEELVNFFQSRGVQPQVEVCPYVHPSLLAELASAGFQLREFENVLVRCLEEAEDFRLALRAPWPAGLLIRRVDRGDAGAVEEYVRLSTHGFFPAGKAMSEGFLRATHKAPLLPHYDSFVARLDGLAVGASGCASRAGLTTLFGTSVLPGFRGRGIHQALIAARLERASERGSPLATIVSHAGLATERNAVRLGFRLAFTRAILVRAGEGLDASP
jgi:GNAT superfamily N-acetyltransferase